MAADLINRSSRQGGEEAERRARRLESSAQPFDDAGLTVDEKAESPASERDSGRREAERGEEEKPESAWSRIKRHRAVVAIVVILAIAALVAIALWWLNARHYESTDDAFIDARPSAISAQLAGAIVSVPVTDNQIVKAGDLLATIDDRDYQAALAQAKAQVAQAGAAIANAAAQSNAQQAHIDATARQVTQAQAALSFSKDQDARAQQLLKSGAGTVQQAQQATSDLKQKQAAFDASQASLEEAQKQLAVLAAQRKSAEAQLAQARAQQALAEANLSRTRLVAPFEGRVTKLTAAVGAYATPGQTLMMIVPLSVWVTANFRETQLADMRSGQKATIEIDAYGRSFPGHVDSIQAGSGTAFSLLPAENATGNYVKVVQRVPVKIVFDKPPDLELGPGMSVVPSVKVR
ncbi:MAG TPA: HlyD family secretion protein [Roseiarcus sp.]|nr:HlyD family secretion protein [Roseiarcus sp.]